MEFFESQQKFRLPLGTDAGPLHFPLQSLVSDVASAGNEQLGVDVFCSALYTFQAKTYLSGECPTIADGREDRTPAN